jgi:hypothetical protein
MSEPTSVVGVEEKEECRQHRFRKEPAWLLHKEAAVNKKEGRYKAANLKA